MIVVVLVASAAILVRVTTAPPEGSQAARCRGVAHCFTGQVTHIVDGDTLDVQPANGEAIRIRLTLVNTPEVGEPGYQEGKDFTARTCPVGSQALVDEDDGQQGGSYGRMIALVYCGEANLNAGLLQGGYAVILTDYCSKSEFAADSWATACH